MRQEKPKPSRSRPMTTPMPRHDLEHDRKPKTANRATVRDQLERVKKAKGEKGRDFRGMKNGRKDKGPGISKIAEAMKPPY
jgi:hypothetical protein